MKKFTMPEVTSLQQVAAGRRDVYQIDARLLHFLPGFNERKEMGDLEPLVDAAVKGKLPPLLTRILDGKIYVVDGERRTRAAHIGIERGLAVQPLSCLPEPRGFTDVDRTLVLIQRNSGKALTLLEEARVIRRLAADHSLDEKDIVERTHKSRTHVRNCLALLQSPVEVLSFIEKGKIAASLVIDLITETKGDPTALLHKVTAAIEKADGKGKKQATRKDLPAEEPEASSKEAETSNEESPDQLSDEIPSDSANESSSSSEETPGAESKDEKPLTGIDAIKAADSNAIGHGLHGHTGEGGTADTRAKKLNKLLEDTPADKCRLELRDFLEMLVDYLDNNRPLGDIKKKILL